MVHCDSGCTCGLLALHSSGGNKYIASTHAGGALAGPATLIAGAAHR